MTRMPVNQATKATSEEELSSNAAAAANLLSAEQQRSRLWKPVIDGKVQPDLEEARRKMIETWSRVRKCESSQSSQQQEEQQQEEQPQHEQQQQAPKACNIAKQDDCNDSESEFRRVPEMIKMPSSSTTSRKKGASSSHDKEKRRLKRLLRNRVSAQQARERKKAYMIDLERKARELEARNAELEEKISTLQRENYMLRQIVKNTTMAQ